MKLIRYMIAVLLLVTSNQAMALFMPYDIKEITDTRTSDGGCGHSIEHNMATTSQ